VNTGTGAGGGGQGSGTDLPSVYRRTGGIAVAPGHTATNGIFTVTGVTPGKAVWDSVFTWKLGDFYSRGKYTVAGLGISLAGADPASDPRRL